MISDSKPSRKFQALDSLRGIAALMVALFHFVTVSPGSTPNHFTHQDALMGHFWLFTDFFFVLSGFVLSYRYFTRTFSIGDYLKSRCCRLYPMHILTTLFCVIIIAQAASLERGHEAVDLLLTLLNLHIFYAEITTWNIISWSVSAELVGSVLCGLAFWTLARRNKKYFALIAGTICAIACSGLLVIGKGLDLYYGYGWVRGIAGIAVGCLAYAAFQKAATIQASRHLATIIEAISIILFLLLMFHYRNETFYLPLLASSATIIVFAHEKGLISSLLKQPAFLWLGTISYSIYLNQMIIFFVVEMFLKLAGISHAMIMDTHNHLLLAGALGLYFVTLICFSSFTYKMIEKPWLRKKPIAL